MAEEGPKIRERSNHISKSFTRRTSSEQQQLQNEPPPPMLDARQASAKSLASSAGSPSSSTTGSQLSLGLGSASSSKRPSWLGSSSSSSRPMEEMGGQSPTLPRNVLENTDDIIKEGLLMKKVHNKHWKARYIVIKGSLLLEYALDSETSKKPDMREVVEHVTLRNVQLLCNKTKVKFILVKNDKGREEEHAYRAESAQSLQAWINAVGRSQTEYVHDSQFTPMFYSGSKREKFSRAASGLLSMLKKDGKEEGGRGRQSIRRSRRFSRAVVMENTLLSHQQALTTCEREMINDINTIISLITAPTGTHVEACGKASMVIANAGKLMALATRLADALDIPTSRPAVLREIDETLTALCRALGSLVSCVDLAFSKGGVFTPLAAVTVEMLHMHAAQVIKSLLHVGRLLAPPPLHQQQHHAPSSAHSAMHLSAGDSTSRTASARISPRGSQENLQQQQHLQQQQQQQHAFAPISPLTPRRGSASPGCRSKGHSPSASPSTVPQLSDESFRRHSQQLEEMGFAPDRIDYALTETGDVIKAVAYLLQDTTPSTHTLAPTGSPSSPSSDTSRPRSRTLPSPRALSPSRSGSVPVLASESASSPAHTLPHPLSAGDMPLMTPPVIVTNELDEAGAAAIIPAEPHAAQQHMLGISDHEGSMLTSDESDVGDGEAGDSFSTEGPSSGVPVRQPGAVLRAPAKHRFSVGEFDGSQKDTSLWPEDFSSSSALNYNPALLSRKTDQLIGMGFSRSEAVSTLKRNKMNLESSLADLIASHADPDEDDHAHISALELMRDEDEDEADFLSPPSSTSATPEPSSSSAHSAMRRTASTDGATPVPRTASATTPEPGTAAAAAASGSLPRATARAPASGVPGSLELGELLEEGGVVFRVEEVEGRKIRRVKGGSLESLVSHLISDANDDPDFLTTVVLCHGFFTTPSDFVHTLLARHQAFMDETERLSAASVTAAVASGAAATLTEIGGAVQASEALAAVRRRHRRTCSVVARSLSELWPSLSDGEVRDVTMLAGDMVRLGYLDLAADLRDQILSLQQASGSGGGGGGVAQTASEGAAMSSAACTPAVAPLASAAAWPTPAPAVASSAVAGIAAATLAAGGTGATASSALSTVTSASALSFALPFPPASPLSALSVESRPLTVLDVHSMDLAREITAIDSELFQRITAAELLLWSRTQDRARSPNIVAQINFATALTRWGMAQVCECFDLKRRARIYHKLVDVMVCLKKLHNFDSLMALRAAFNSASVSRMELTKEASGARTIANLEKINALLSHDKSYSVYRAALSHCARPAIPYLGVYLTDLTFIQQGNPNTIPSLYNADAKFINISKFHRLANVVRAVKHFQSEPYVFESTNPRLRQMLAAPVEYTDDQLHALSLHNEPRTQ